MLKYEFSDPVSFEPIALPQTLEKKGIVITEDQGVTTMKFPEGWIQDDDYNLPYSKNLADNGIIVVIKNPEGAPCMRIIHTSESYVFLGVEGYPTLKIGPHAKNIS